MLAAAVDGDGDLARSVLTDAVAHLGRAVVGRDADGAVALVPVADAQARPWPS